MKSNEKRVEGKRTDDGHDFCPPPQKLRHHHGAATAAFPDTVDVDKNVAFILLRLALLSMRDN